MNLTLLCIILLILIIIFAGTCISAIYSKRITDSLRILTCVSCSGVVGMLFGILVILIGIMS